MGKEPSGIRQSATLNESPVISKTDMLMAEATEIMDKMELLDDQYKKLLDTKAAQSKELETLNSTCKMKCAEIDSLKALLVDKDKVMADSTKIMDKMELLTAQYKKLLVTNEAQSKALETISSTGIIQCCEIESLKTLLVEKDNAESQAENTEWQAEIAHEKILELENKLKAKEEEVGKLSNKLEGMSNSLMDRMERIEKTIGPFVQI